MATSGPTATTWPATSLPGTKGSDGLDLVLPGHEEAVHEIHAGRLDGHGHLARPGLGIGTLLHPQDGGWTQFVADGGAHGPKR